ncbi:MAG TPA: sigma factor-like helix-turn-helix DNA-binding protein, partial [Ignavibacteriaceae bacterium]
LPKRCQKVIYLKFYEGLTTEGIVEKSGLNKRTVYNNLFEGIKMLRSELSINKAAEQFAILLSLLSLAFTKVFFKV